MRRYHIVYWSKCVNWGDFFRFKQNPHRISKFINNGPRRVCCVCHGFFFNFSQHTRAEGDRPHMSGHTVLCIIFPFKKWFVLVTWPIRNLTICENGRVLFHSIHWHIVIVFNHLVVVAPVWFLSTGVTGIRTKNHSYSNNIHLTNGSKTTFSFGLSSTDLTYYYYISVKLVL